MRPQPDRQLDDRSANASLGDHAIRAKQNRLRNIQSESLSSLEVDDQLELCGLLDWKVRRLCALEYLVHVAGRAPEQLLEVRPIGHQTACPHDKLLVVVYRRQSIPRRKLYDPD